MKGVMMAIANQVKTQEKLEQEETPVSSIEKMKILFDFDGDSLLESDSTDIKDMNYVSEQQITRDTFKGLTSD